MAKITKTENGNYKVELSQQELNTIALLLGHSSDELVKEKAEDWEIQQVSIKSELDSLYSNFFRHMK